MRVVEAIWKLYILSGLRTAAEVSERTCTALGSFLHGLGDV
jgi:hypothetical protein